MTHEPGDLSNTHFKFEYFLGRGIFMAAGELFFRILEPVFVILAANVVWHITTNYKIVKK